MTEPNPSNEAQGKLADLEIKDATLIFRSIWNDLEFKYGRSGLRFPKEVIWLGGAPGAGKGTNTPFILEERGFTTKPLVISELLDSEEARRIKDSGGMVGDKEVISLLLNELLNSQYESGVIVDGFPRTKVQVECLKMFYHKIIDLKNEFHNTDLEKYFRYPLFRITVLFVEERVSIERQLLRGRQASEHNSTADQEGLAKLDIRKTDLTEEFARRRYQTFKEKTYDALQSLRDHFHYHFIHADGPIEEVQRNISKEFQYQSSLELDHDIFEMMRHIPLASEIVIHTRQELVKRLEGYYNHHESVFRQIIRLVEEQFTERIRMHSSSGYVLIHCNHDLLNDPFAVDMLVDVLAERGFYATVDHQEIYIPQSIDPKTHCITCVTQKKHAVHVRFKGSKIRRGN